MQDALVSAAEDVTPNEKRRKRKAWMTDEILDLVKEKKSKEHFRGKITRIR